MRAAPPVVHPLASTGAWIGSSVLLAAAAAGVPIAWVGWHLRAARLGGTVEFLALAGLGLSAIAVAAALAWRRAQRRRGEQLRWDGGRWQLLDAKGHAWSVSTPGTAIDLGPLMLLYTRHALDGTAAWLPMRRADAPASWHGLRVALGQPPAPPASTSGVAA
jgi:hypothetical protein